MAEEREETWQGQETAAGSTEGKPAASPPRSGLVPEFILGLIVSLETGSLSLETSLLTPCPKAIKGGGGDALRLLPSLLP